MQRFITSNKGENPRVANRFGIAFIALIACWLPRAANAINFTVAAGDVPGFIAAINAANAAGGSNIITLMSSTYTFTTTDNLWYGPDALPAIASDITIEGNGAFLLVNNGNQPLRFFFIGADPTAPATLNFPTPGAGKLTLKNLTLSGGMQAGGSAQSAGNGPGRGGAIFNEGTATISGVTFTHNQVSGAPNSGAGAVVDPDSLGNGMGGAIFNHGGSLTINNSTFAANAASGGASNGGGGGSGLGGALCNINGTVALNCATLAFNTALAGAGTASNGLALGGAVYSLGYSSANLHTAFSANNTILANNTGFDLAADQPTALEISAGGGPNGATSTIAFSGANIVMTGGTFRNATVANGSTTPLTSDPLLANTPANYGGFTQTLLPAPNSPALNAGDNASVANLSTDQRGQPRISNGAVDIGAVEMNLALVIVAGNNQSATVNTAFATALQIKATEIGSGTVYSGISVNFSAPASGVSGNFAANASGSTDTNGLFTAPILTANTISGLFTATASATNFAPANFLLKNLPGVPATMVIFAGDNQTQVTGKVLEFQQCVLIRDQYSNGVPNVQVTFTVTGGGGEVTGAFTLTNPQGIGIDGTWRVGALPGDNTLEAAAAGVAGSVTFHATATNLPPVIDSVSVSPDNPQIGDTVTITVTAHDPENDPLAINYDFGDGTVAISPSHEYLTPGVFHAVIRVGDGVSIVENDIDISIGGTLDLNGDGIVSPIDTDSDFDGFPDYIETALGTNPNDKSSTPFNGQPAGKPGTFPCTLDMTLNKILQGVDSISVGGTLHLNAGEAINGPKFLLDVSGNTQIFILDDTGKGKTLTAAFSMRVKTKNKAIAAQDAPFIAKFKNGSYLKNIAANSTPNANGNPDHAVVTIVFNGRFLIAIVPLQFKNMAKGKIKTVHAK